MKYYVVSDIHSYYTATIEALTEQGFFNDTEPHKLIICGDLFDRGDESKEMQDFVLDLIKKDEVILIRGNHEDLFMELYRNANYWFNRDIFYSHHARNGTVKTVAALTGANTDDLLNAEKMSALMKKTPFYTTIIPKTINYYETKTHIFVHGWIPCKKGVGYKSKLLYYNDNWRQATEEEWEESRWLNGMDAWHQGVVEVNKVIICGHWHTSYGHSQIRNDCPEFGPDADFSPFMDIGILAIDGCVALTNKVNCVVIHDEE